MHLLLVLQRNRNSFGELPVKWAYQYQFFRSLSAKFDNSDLNATPHFGFGFELTPFHTFR